MKINCSKINIVGAGFVGLTLAAHLARMEWIKKVTIIDVDKDKLKNLSEGKVHVKERDLDLTSPKISYLHIDRIPKSKEGIFFICVGTPTINGVQNIDAIKSAIQSITEKVTKSTIVIKSTTLPENVEKLVESYPDAIILTNPEFLAEGSAVKDLITDRKVIVGSTKEYKEYAVELMNGIYGQLSQVYSVSLTEAMTIKYFLNSYKAMKINFINEFNDYCKIHNMSFKAIRDVVNKDAVLGKGFDVPGLGFGGSCFPKDTNAIGSSIEVCKDIYNRNEFRISEFVNSVYGEVKALADERRRRKFKKYGKIRVLIVGKSFKIGTNDTRCSVAVKVGEGLVSRCDVPIEVSYYDEVPELTDIPTSELPEKLNDFDFILIMNDYPEVTKLIDKNKDKLKLKPYLINTRFYL